MKNLYNNIKINYAFMFVKNIHLSQGIWMIYLASKGLSLFEIGTLEAIFHITSFLMETPTGALADIFGRKISRIIGLLFSIISAILMIVSNSYILFAISFALSALSYNFESGAGEALIYDSLKAVNKQDHFMKITGNNEVIYQITQVLALILGGLIGSVKYVNVYYFAIVISILAIIIALFFIEPKRQMSKEEGSKLSFANALKNQYKDSFEIVKGSKKLLYLILFTTMLFASCTLSFFYVQIAFKDIGLSIATIGIYLAIVAIASAIGAFLAEKIEKKVGEVKILRYGSLVFGVSIIALYFTKYAIVPLIILNFTESILFVATRDYINKLIPSAKRATILSFDSMMFSFYMIITFPIFGLVSDNIGMSSTFVIFGGLILLLVLINLFVKPFSK